MLINRTSEHGWRRFPFWYTVLALSEMEIDEAEGGVEVCGARTRTHREPS